MSKARVMALSVIAASIIASAASVNATQAENSIKNASEDVKEMKRADISVSRVQNLLDEANQSYQAQLALKSRGKKYDFSRVRELVSRIQGIRERAFRAKDEIDALEQKLKTAEKVNETAAREQLELARRDFRSQRFSEAIEHVEKSYQELSEAQAVSTQVKAFIEAKREGIRNYIRQNKSFILGVSLAALVAILFLYNEFRVWRLLLRRHRLDHRKEVAEDSLENLDEKYFQENDISKNVYELRREKYRSIRENAETRIPEIETSIRNSITVTRVLLSALNYLGSEDGTAQQGKDEEKEGEDESSGQKDRKTGGEG